jgi:acetyl esterase/lipase
VVPDYRLYPAVRFPGFMQDAARAVAWSRAAARGLGADPDRIVLMGHSAGAQIAALLATDPRYLEAAGVPPRAIAGVVGLSGPYDFDPRGYPALEAIFGAPETWPQARPVRFVDATDPPFLIIHGTGDHTVYSAQSETLAARLREAGVAVDLLLLPGVGHVRPLLALRYPRLGPVLDRTFLFVDSVAPRTPAAAQASP